MNKLKMKINEMSTGKLAVYAVGLVMLSFIILILLAIYAPKVLIVLGCIFVAGCFFAATYGFCYAIIYEHRNGW